MNSAKKYLLIFLSIFILCCLTGCGESLSRSEVVSYVEDTLGLTNCTIPRSPTKTDKSLETWVIYDNDEAVEFYVYPGLRGSGENVPSIQNVILDNYAEMIVQKHAKRLPATIEHVAPGDNSDFTVDVGTFTINYANIEDLGDSCEKFWTFAENVREKHDIPIPVHFKYDIEYDTYYQYPPFDYSVADSYGHIGSAFDGDTDYIDSYEDLLETAKKGLFTYAYVYQDPELIKLMSAKDIQNVLESNKDLLTIYFVTDLEKAKDENDTYHEQILSADGEVTTPCTTCLAYNKDMASHYRITYGALYTILKSYEKNVTGDPTHFTYTSDDEEDKYEFSYDFWDDETGSYYLKNGKKVRTELDEKNCLNHALILYIFGIYVDFPDFPYLSKDTGFTY